MRPDSVAMISLYERHGPATGGGGIVGCMGSVATGRGGDERAFSPFSG
jgi:hypothetical protein